MNNNKGEIMRRLFAILLFFVSLPSFAVAPVYTSFFSNKAVGGYDTVAYFTEHKPVKGNDKFSTEYNGAKWYFSSQNNLELFKKDPTKYAPQYGGYCAWAIADSGSAVSGDPKVWAVVNGKLYLNYSKDVQKEWDKDRAGLIAKADKAWPEVLKK